ncbi:MAG TPA: glycosyltransferase family 4 protein [Thermoanaerobaculia bacterium]|nr:glycosyltransferase family 4 protein [Thermoanaerobaculia bacterium]
MKIVYVLESLELSGGVKVIVQHAEGLAARGHEVVLVTKDARHDWIPIRVPVVEVPRFDAETLPPADVHVATWFPTVAPTVAARRAPKVFHFSQGYEAPHPHTRHRLAEIEEAYRQPVPKILVSAHLLRDLEGRYPGPFHVLGQVLDAAAFRPPGEPREGARRPATIGGVGPFLAEKKGIDVALRAVARLRAAGRSLALHRASHMPEAPGEGALTRIDDYVQGRPAAEMPAWYQALDLLIHPSFDAEGFPLPPLEAMASGVPVVLTDIPSFAPLPRDAASFVPEGDDAAMAVAAARLLSDAALWRLRRRRGLEVAATFTLGPVLDRLERIFRG